MYARGPSRWNRVSSGLETRGEGALCVRPSKGVSMSKGVSGVIFGPIGSNWTVYVEILV